MDLFKNAVLVGTQTIFALGVPMRKGALLVSLLLSSAVSAQNLEIHYINVGWGGSALVIGPDGTTVLLEAGDTGKGTGRVVPYLKSIGLQPAAGLDYTIAGHQHCDHIGGLDEVVGAGYDIHTRNYYNGSSYASTCVDGWNAASATTTAGAPLVPVAGEMILLGDGARLYFVAVDGHIAGGGTVSVSDENDRSIAVLVQYGGFEWLWASDMGGGSDTACTGRSTTQANVETSVITAISPGGAFPLISSQGIDVLHVNHHGSESSSNKDWMNLSRPAVAVISTGAGQSSGWDLPRIDVVEHVLLAQSTACITVPPAFVLQTEEGSPTGSLTSFAGYSVGDIEFSTDGLTGFTVSADGAVSQGPNEVAAAGLPRTFGLDDGPANQPPTVATPAAANPDPVAGTSAALSVLGADDGGEPALTYTWSGSASFSANGTNAAKDTTATFSAAGNYPLTVTIRDAQGATTTSSVTVTVAQTIASVAVTPPSASVNAGGSQQFSASARDQFGAAVAASFTWSVSDGGAIDQSGLFTAGPAAGGPFAVSATAGSVTGNASVTVLAPNTAPSVAIAAAANPNPVTGTSAAVSVLGADDGGETGLTYTWSGASFSANGTNAAKNSTATFGAAGTYTLTVTITDGGGLSTTSSVNVVVSSTLTSVAVSPSNVNVSRGQTQQFTASAHDQFGSSIPASFAWTAGGGAIDHNGLFTAGNKKGNFTVTASSGSKSGTASVHIR